MNLRDLSADTLVLALNLFVLLPIWSVSGFVDFLCHRRTKIEETTGLKESVLHITMGAQVGLPMWLLFFFEVNVAVMLVGLFMLATHEVVAHMDVDYAAPRRHISTWEQRAHSYLLTMPFYSLSLVIVRHFDVFLKTITLDWAGGFTFAPRAEPVGMPVGSKYYVLSFFLLMVGMAFVPYAEEVWRCWRAEKRRAAAGPRAPEAA